MPEESLLSPRQIPGAILPHEFFTQVLPSITRIEELVALLQIYQVCGRDGHFRPYFVIEAIESILGPDDVLTFRTGLTQAIEHDFILPPIPTKHKDATVSIGVINNPAGRQVHEIFRTGGITIPESEFEISFEPPRANIFKLYEANIGPLSPMIADALRELDQNYPADWVEEAISIAVRNNARKLRYIEAILKSWQEEGKHERTDKKRRKKTSEQFDPEGYTDGEFSDFLDY